MEALIEIPDDDGAEHYFLLLEDAETGVVLTQRRSMLTTIQLGLYQERVAVYSLRR